MHVTGTIVGARKDVFAPDAVVTYNGEQHTVKGRRIETGVDYIHVSSDAIETIQPWMIARLGDVHIPRDEQVVGLAVQFDVIGVGDKTFRAVNVTKA